MGYTDQKLGLYTDFYELSMAQGYLFGGKRNQQVCFDYYFRTNPYKGGFTVFAGLYDLLEILLNDFVYSEEDIAYLKDQGMDGRFLDYLRKFRFKGNIFSSKAFCSIS